MTKLYILTVYKLKETREDVIKNEIVTLKDDSEDYKKETLKKVSLNYVAEHAFGSDCNYSGFDDERMFTVTWKPELGSEEFGDSKQFMN